MKIHRNNRSEGKKKTKTKTKPTATTKIKRGKQQTTEHEIENKQASKRKTNNKFLNIE